MPLPRCFFDITINGVPSGRIVFELFSDICPKTCENFRSLCTGEKGEGKTTFVPLHYKATPIHRIVKGYIIQGGDFSSGDGTGGESIYGGMFKDEDFSIKHDRPFLLSMANKGPNTNGSQFFITLRPAPHLDGIHVVFGHVVQGKQFVTEIESQKVDSNHRPYADVRIANCGELVLVKGGKAMKPERAKAEMSSSSSTEESSSEESFSESESENSSSGEKKKRRKRTRIRESKRGRKSHRKRSHRKQKRGTRRKKHESESSSVSECEGQPSDVPPPQPMVTSTITEEDLPPEIVSTSRSWLYRRSKSPSPKAGEKKKTKPVLEAQFKHRENEVSKSGRKLKGRGLMRYRTPPRHVGVRHSYEGRERWEKSPSPLAQRSRSGSREKRMHISPRRRWNFSPKSYHSRYKREHGHSPSLRVRDSSRSPTGRSRSPRRGRSGSREERRHRRNKERGKTSYYRREDAHEDAGTYDESEGTSSGEDSRHQHRDCDETAPSSPPVSRNREQIKGDSHGQSSEKRWEGKMIDWEDKSSSPPRHKAPSRTKERQVWRSSTESPFPDQSREKVYRQKSESEDLGSDTARGNTSQRKYNTTGLERKDARKSRSRSPKECMYKKSSKHGTKSSALNPEDVASTFSSKWARHHDSAESTSEEEVELERVYQRSQQAADNEDVFGIAELSKEYFSQQ